jgi:tetratricopeptide (TPR) repeat protein
VPRKSTGLPGILLPNSISRVGSSWPLHSEHSGALLRLRRLVEHRRSFVLCFLTYSDSAYRDTVAGFLDELLGARVRVAIDGYHPVGTEDLFGRLSDCAYQGPAQLIGLESWPDGLDDLLKRLNYRREAFAARCQRPLLLWIRKRDVQTVATGAADLWAWRSGVFDFSLPEVLVRAEQHHVRTDLVGPDRPARQQRLLEVERHLRARPSLQAADVDLLVELGDLQDALGQPEDAQHSYSQALTAASGTDDRRRRVLAQGRIANLLETRGDLDEALRIRGEQIPIYERLGDVRSLAVTRGQIADILQARGDLDEALRIRRGADTDLRTPWGCAFARRYPGSDRRHRRRRYRSTNAWGTSVRLPSPGVGLPIFCRRAGTWTRRCASAGRRRYRSTNASGTSVRLPLPGVGSPIFCRRAGTWTRRCASAGRRRYRSTSASGTSVRLPLPGVGSPIFCRRAGTWTRRCASAERSRFRSTNGLGMCVLLPSPEVRSPTWRRRYRSTSASGTSVSAGARGAGRGVAHPNRRGITGL